MTSIISSSRVRNAGLLLAAALLLTACGSSNDDDKVTVPPPPVGTTPPPVATDTFIQTVMARIASLLDNDEPIVVETIPVTSPEDTEPVPVPTP
jgi:hypothetical protein